MSNLRNADFTLAELAAVQVKMFVGVFTSLILTLE